MNPQGPLLMATSTSAPAYLLFGAHAISAATNKSHHHVTPWVYTKTFNTVGNLFNYFLPSTLEVYMKLVGSSKSSELPNPPLDFTLGFGFLPVQASKAQTTASSAIFTA